jgi:conjugal transfer/entry exclusion protein
MLQKTHRAWRTFKREHFDKFQDRAPANRIRQSLSAIEATFARLEAISQDIESMDKRRCRIQEEVSDASQSENTPNCEGRG